MEEISLMRYCEQTGKTALIRQWSVPENKDFDPLKTGFASHKKIWWVCERARIERHGRTLMTWPALILRWQLSGILRKTER